MSRQIRRYSFLCIAASASWLIVSALATANPSAAQGWSPDRKTIVDLEHSIRLPLGAKPIGKYSRYYTGVIRNGSRQIRGVFTIGKSESVIVDSEASLPGTLDGGCDIVNNEYDVARHRFVQD